MNGWNFPTLFSGNAVDIISGTQDVIKDLNLLVNSEMFEFRFDPVCGSNVPLLRFRPKTQLTKDLIVDAIFDIQNYCPNVRFDRSQVVVNFLSEPGTIQIYIPAVVDNQDFITDIVLYVEATE